MKTANAVFVCALLIMSTACRTWAETTAYIPNRDGNTVTRVLTEGETFDSVALADDPYGSAVTPDGEYVFVTRSGADSVTRIPTNNFTNTGAQVDIDVGNDPRGVAVDPEDGYAYVANYADDTVSKIAVNSTTVEETISVGNGPLGVAAAYDQENDIPLVYVTNALDNNLSIIGENDEVIETIDTLCSEPAGVAVTPNGAAVYVACSGSDQVKVIRTSNNTIATTINVGQQPWGVAAGSNGRYVFVTNSADDTVSVIATSTNSVIDTITVGDQPMGVAAPLNGDFAYVINQLDNSIHKIDVSTDPISVAEIGVNQLNTAVSIGMFIGGQPPSAPSGLAAETVDSNEIELTWTDNSTNELGFKIERREDSVETFEQVVTVDADSESYTDTDLERGTTYHYRVRSYNEAADSAASSSAEATTDDEEFSWCFIGTVYAGSTTGPMTP